VNASLGVELWWKAARRPCRGTKQVTRGRKHASGVESRGRRRSPEVGPGGIPERAGLEVAGKGLVGFGASRRS
jgi:hypothetical protein